jgi:hypothetical protein
MNVHQVAAFLKYFGKEAKAGSEEAKEVFRTLGGDLSTLETPKKVEKKKGDK